MNKNFKVDVPVMLFIFVRPHTLTKVFEVISDVKPSVLFLVSDGPRENVPTDKEKILKSREVVDTIDWDCEVHRLYSDTNQGMYETERMAREYAFKYVDRLILLEDDVIPSKSFFKFCGELLEEYKDDYRINRICGMNHLGVYKEPSSDYFFSKEGSIWGYAIWKRTHENYDYSFHYSEDKYTIKRLMENTLKGKKMKAKYLNFPKGIFVDGKRPGPEFFLSSACELYHQLNIVSSINLVKNIGVGQESTNSGKEYRLLPKGIRRVFNMETYEHSFPLQHPKYVIEDRRYLKKVYRIMGWGHPLVILYRKIEIFLRKRIWR